MIEVQQEITQEKPKSGKELLDDFRKARGELLDSVKGLKDRDMKRAAFDGWSVKDVISHIIEWDIKSVIDSNELIAGRKIDTACLNDVDAFNAEVIRQYKPWSLHDVMTGIGLSSQRVMSFLAGVSDQSLEVGEQDLNGEKITVRWLIDCVNHDLEHARQIREWREGMGK